MKWTKYYNSHKQQVSYLLIPKCGSTSIQHMLDSEESTATQKPLYTSFTVLRFPKERFISGYWELRKRNRFLGTPDELLEEINTIGFFDPHIKPQSEYFEPVDKVFIGLYAFLNLRQWLGSEYQHMNQGNYEQTDIQNIELFIKLYDDDYSLTHIYGAI